MATSERLRLAGSKWLAVDGFVAFLFKEVILSDKNMKAALSAAKSVVLTQPTTLEEAECANGQVSLHDMLP